MALTRSASSSQVWHSQAAISASSVSSTWRAAAVKPSERSWAMAMIARVSAGAFSTRMTLPMSLSRPKVKACSGSQIRPSRATVRHIPADTALCSQKAFMLNCACSCWNRLTTETESAIVLMVLKPSRARAWSRPVTGCLSA